MEVKTMTKQEALRRQYMTQALERLGLSMVQADKIRLISKTLGNWAEKECGIDRCCIERDDVTNKPYWTYEGMRDGKRTRYPIADKEAGAIKRLNAIMANYPTLAWYHQRDPRGAQVYIYRKSDLRKDANIDSYYSSVGIAVY